MQERPPDMRERLALRITLPDRFHVRRAPPHAFIPHLPVFGTPQALCHAPLLLGAALVGPVEGVQKGQPRLAVGVRLALESDDSPGGAQKDENGERQNAPGRHEPALDGFCSRFLNLSSFHE
jgi:hypothetical protein